MKIILLYIIILIFTSCDTPETYLCYSGQTMDNCGNCRECESEECGWNEVNIHTKKSKELIARGKPPLSACTLEHSDGNPDNNKLDNLKILCPSCHSLTKFYGSRGKGHDERRNRFSKEKKQ